MRKSRLCSLLCTAAAAALGAGCGLSVKSDFNKALVSSVHCGTYAWAGAFRGSSALRNTIANPVNEERLRAAIASHVSPATIQPVGSSADCLVGYGIGGNYVVDGGYPYGYGWGYGWGYGGLLRLGRSVCLSRGHHRRGPVRRQERPADLARLRRSEPL